MGDEKPYLGKIIPFSSADLHCAECCKDWYIL